MPTLRNGTLASRLGILISVSSSLLLYACASDSDAARSDYEIVNGHDAMTDDMDGPLGAVVRVNQSCSGTLVRSDVVITSKHCLEPDQSPARYWITVNSPEGPHPSSGPHAYTARSYWLHPTVDLAVIQLERNVTEVQPVPILDDRTPVNEYYSGGSDVLTAGYGANGWRPEFLEEVEAATGDADAMQALVDRYMNEFWRAYTFDGSLAYADTHAVHLTQHAMYGWVIQLESYLLSATDPQGTTPLWGDSGGTFLREVEGQHYLVGTTQAGYISGHADGIIFRCFGVYTPAYLDWIEGLVGPLTCADGAVADPDETCSTTTIDHCESESATCGEHGSCVSDADTYTCECEAGYQNGALSVDPQAACCQPVWMDADGDGFGDPNQSTCSTTGATGNWVSNNLDCNDENIFSRPDRVEVCGDGMDNDCDGMIDETCGCNGDINLDGTLDYHDAYHYILFIRDGVELPSYQNADVNGDGEYNAGDALLTINLVLEGASCG